MTPTEASLGCCGLYLQNRCEPQTQAELNTDTAGIGGVIGRCVMLVCSGSAVTGCMTARKRPVKLTEADITRPDPAHVDTMTSEHTPSSCPVGFDNLNSNSLSTFPRKQ